MPFPTYTIYSSFIYSGFAHVRLVIINEPGLNIS